MPLNTGTILNNRYRIVSLLGQGGFGAVYRAWDMEMKAPCAVKENLDLSAESQRQFKREARMLFKLRHSNLPKVYGSFSIPGMGQYLVMDFIEGEDLQQMLDKKGGPLLLEDVQKWIGEVCEALVYMHSRQPPIIHRDIKPANIKITPDREAVLVDFGIAKEFDPGQKTFTGARAYTPGYASPEQQGGKGTDALSDIYSLGATTYALLTGLVPPSATDIISEITPPPEPVNRVNPHVPKHVSRAIEAAMQIPRSKRTASVEVFKTELTKGKAVKPASSPPQLPVKKTVQAGGVAPGGKASREGSVSTRGTRNWFPWVIGILAVIVIMGGIIIWNQNDDSEAKHAPQTVQAVINAPTQTDIMLTKMATDSPTSTPTDTAIPTRTPHPTRTSTPIATPTPDFGAPMVLIPAGEFTMGGDADDALIECKKFYSGCKRSWYEDEEPPHPIFLEDYYIDMYEVTNAQFAEFLNDIGNRMEGGVTWLDAKGEDTRIHNRGDLWNVDTGYEDHPVIEVSWFGAMAYCKWRSARLPTEAEWEKAARGGLKGKKYPWGDKAPVCKPGAKNGVQYKKCPGKTVPVGIFSSNGYGLYDMAGNVWEWVADWYNAHYYLNSPYEDPQGPKSGELRVMRGGSWYVLYSLRSALRFYNRPSNTDGKIGFRCARSP